MSTLQPDRAQQSACAPEPDVEWRAGVDGNDDAQRLAEMQAEWASWDEASAPLTPSERRQRIDAADAARLALVGLVSVRPDGGGNVDAASFAVAMRRLPDDDAARKALLSTMMARVTARLDVTPTGKLVYAQIATASMGKCRHCFHVLSAIGLRAGLAKKDTISRAIIELAELGLVARAVEQQRVFAVPTVIDSDLTGAVRDGLRLASKALDQAGVAFPHRAAMALATAPPVGTPGLPRTPCARTPGSGASSDDRHNPTPQLPSREAGRHTPLAVPSGGTAIRGTTQEVLRAAGIAPDRRTSTDDVWGQANTRLHARAPLDEVDIGQDRLHEAGRLCPDLTAPELRANFERYRSTEGRPTWGAFINGLSRPVETKRAKLRRLLGGDDAINAFLGHDRQNNGNSRAALADRVETWRVGPGAPFDLKRRARERSLAARWAAGTHAFEIEGTDMVIGDVWTGSVRVPLGPLLALNVRDEAALLDAIGVALVRLSRTDRRTFAPDEIVDAVAQVVKETHTTTLL